MILYSNDYKHCVMLLMPKTTKTT